MLSDIYKVDYLCVFHPGLSSTTNSSPSILWSPSHCWPPLSPSGPRACSSWICILGCIQLGSARVRTRSCYDKTRQDLAATLRSVPSVSLQLLYKSLSYYMIIVKVRVRQWNDWLTWLLSWSPLYFQNNERASRPADSNFYRLISIFWPHLPYLVKDHRQCFLI